MDSRERYLKNKIKNKTVLDLGVGDTTDRSLHVFINKYAKKTIGVELDKIRAQRLQKKGFNVIQGNAETIKIEKKFDVVMAGDLIEHLNNVGLFLETVKKHLKKNGLFIFNTPNAYSINFLIRGLLFGGKVPQFNEHTYLFTEDLITEILKRYNLKITNIKYFSHKNNNLKSIIIRIFGSISKRWHENIYFEVHKI